jgi:hypothetical protein
MSNHVQLHGFSIDHKSLKIAQIKKIKTLCVSKSIISFWNIFSKNKISDFFFHKVFVLPKRTVVNLYFQDFLKSQCVTQCYGVYRVPVRLETKQTKFGKCCRKRWQWALNRLKQTITIEDEHFDPRWSLSMESKLFKLTDEWSIAVLCYF